MLIWIFGNSNDTRECRITLKSWCKWWWSSLTASIRYNCYTTEAPGSKIRSIAFITGDIRLDIGAVLPSIGNTSRIRKNIPYRSSSYHCCACSSGNMPPTILNPSKGWIGIRLNTARTTFKVMSEWSMFNTKKSSMPINGISATLSRIPSNTCSRIALTVANRMLETGPATEISAASRLGLRRLYGSNGTGLPQPKRAMRIIIVPSGSRCANGFKVNRPMSRGVGSPSLSAVKAWANS